MSYVAKLPVTGEDLSRYLNKIEAIGLRKSLLLAPHRRSDTAAKCLILL